MPEQNFANHRKFVPGYHYVLYGILTVNLVWAMYRLCWGLPGVPLFDRILAVAMALAFMLIALYARTFPLKVQDRLIRLEETQRLERLLPPDLRARAGELRTGQLVALRFASDAELADLTRAVLDEKIVTQNEIKKRIRSWRADHFRM
jgi:Family of unknown function (DUF6526)